MQTCIWLSWCYCHSLSLASVKSRLVLPFWYWLTWLVRVKRAVKWACVCVGVPDRKWKHIFMSTNECHPALHHPAMLWHLNVWFWCLYTTCKSYFLLVWLAGFSWLQRAIGWLMTYTDMWLVDCSWLQHVIGWLMTYTDMWLVDCSWLQWWLID